MHLPTRYSAAVAVFSLAMMAVACQPKRLTPSSNPALNLHGPDILVTALSAEIPPPTGAQRRQLVGTVDTQAERIRAELPRQPTSKGVFEALQREFFSEKGFAASNDPMSPETISIVAALQTRRGSCVGLAIVYLALAQRLGLDAHAVATPVHLFVRVNLDGKVRNVELLEAGVHISEDAYRGRYRMDDASIQAGVFMADLTNAEVIAHLLSNQAVALGKQGKINEALARYDEALRLHPKLVAAWYNRGLDLMNSGRLHEALDSFSRAIELYPSDAQAHNNRGVVKVKLGDRDGARADFTQALALQADLFEAERNLKHLDLPAGEHE